MANKTPAIRTVTVRAPVNIAVIKYCKCCVKFCFCKTKQKSSF